MRLLLELISDRSGCQWLCVERIVELERSVSYSYLRATIGSTFIARRAGT
jgi:hypothetical protein